MVTIHKETLVFVLVSIGIFTIMIGAFTQELSARFTKAQYKTTNAGDLKTEDDFVKYFNNFFQGKLEHRLDDLTRVDILTDTMAIEVDFAHKWYEAVGQACHYARKTDKHPAIVLIATSPFDEKYVEAAVAGVDKLRLDTKSISLFVFRHLVQDEIST